MYRQYRRRLPAALLHDLQGPGDPPPPGLALHGRRQDGASTQGLGQDEHVPGLQASLAQDLSLLNLTVDCEACNINININISRIGYRRCQLGNWAWYDACDVSCGVVHVKCDADHYGGHQ